MSWAALVKNTAAAVTTASDIKEGADEKSQRYAVIDANAIINGMQLRGVADRFVTIPEVLSEIRDKGSRQFLASLPYTLEVKEPEEESVKAVTAFARLTGDLHTLSRTDIRLLALAHTLEIAAHGTIHIRQQPVQVAIKPKHRSSQVKEMPGWGNVPNPEDWAEIDALPDNVAAEGKSRIKTAAQALAPVEEEQSNTAQPADATQSISETTAPPAAPLPFASFGDAAAADIATGSTVTSSKPSQPILLSSLPTPPVLPPPVAGVDHFLGAASHTRQSGGADASVAASTHDGSDNDSEDDDDDDDGWAVAGKNRNSERRKKRRQYKREMMQAYYAQLEQPGQAAGEGSSTNTAEAAVDTAGTEPSQAHDQADDVSGSEDEGEEEEGEEEGTESFSATASGTDCGTVVLNTDSSVCSLTADFAMQNVLLQMGLRLVSKDGRQITRLSRWAVRCQGCFFVTKEAGRVFCPRCGGAYLDRVEVHVGPDGAEFFGVRKKHVLKGTRFSLPKPKGGRAVNPILREDELLGKARSRSRKNKFSAADLDPFAPEYGVDTWHSAAGGGSSSTSTAVTQADLLSSKGAAFLNANWKHNPNARKPTSSNRRRK